MKTFTITLIIALTVFASCSNDEDNEPQNSSRTLRYEVTGNFSGKLLITYTDNTGNLKTLQDVSLPWNLEENYPSTVLTVGIGGQASAIGTPGQTATLKVIVNGKVVKSGTGTAGSLGELILPTLAFSF